MDLVVATSASSPFEWLFWKAYADAGGPAPRVTFFVYGREQPAWKRASEGALLFQFAEFVELVNHSFRVSRRGSLHPIAEFFPESRLQRVNSLNEGPGFNFLQRAEPQVLVSVGCAEILRSQVLRVPRSCALNVHNGQLPEYRGLFATFWEMYHGEPEGAITIHHMVEKVDAGTAVARAAVPLGSSLYRALIEKKKRGGALLAQVLTQLQAAPAERSTASNGAPSPKDSANDSYFGWPSVRDQLAFRIRRVWGLSR